MSLIPYLGMTAYRALIQKADDNTFDSKRLHHRLKRAGDNATLADHAELSQLTPDTAFRTALLIGTTAR